MSPVATPAGPVPRRRVGVLLFDGVRTLDVVGPAEVFLGANRQVPGYDLVFVSASGDPVVTSVGLRTEVDGAADDVAHLDTLVVPGGEHRPAPDGAVQRAIRLLAGRSRRVVTVGAGAPATGVAAAMDLALALVEEDHGPDVAQDVARLLRASARREGGASEGTGPVRLPAPRPTLADAIAAYVAADPTRPCSLGDLARHASISTRHLHRVVRRELGVTPMAYVMSLRLDIAVGLLESGMPVADVAYAAGFGTPSALRRSFAGRFGTTPSDYQRRSVPTGRQPDAPAALA